MSASIVAGAAAGSARLTGLSDMTAGDVGTPFKITEAGSPGNNGTFTITGFNSAGSIDIANSNAVIPDANDGTIYWAASDCSAAFKKEPGGTLAKFAGSVTNPNGAMIWNGLEWVVNTTWAHNYFIDFVTDQRLVAHVVTMITASGTYGGYQVTRNTYSYSIARSNGPGFFVYQAIEYVVQQPDTKMLVLRSRGSGYGTADPYFNIYIQDPVAGNSTAAFRNDPVWFTYPNIGPQAAAQQTDEVTGLSGDLPTPNSQYWLDVNQGADLGGYGYHFLTGAIVSSAHNLGSSFPTTFDLQYYDSSSNMVQELRFAPEVLSERLELPVAAPALNGWSLLLAGAGLAALGVWRLCRQRA
jgi:hypothetical protein